MAVLVEALSLIIRRDAFSHARIAAEAFLAAPPNRTVCADRTLIRIGFLAPHEVEDCLADLEAHGLRFLDASGVATDCVVIDQQQGPTTRCGWIGFGRALTPDEGHVVSVAWDLSLPGAPDDAVSAVSRDGLALPAGWRYEVSLSRQFHFTPSNR